MRSGSAAFWVPMLMVWAAAGSAQAESRMYAVVVGNNSAPANTSLDTLRYADDDAVRYYRFFKQFTSDVQLLTIPDSRTQARYPDASKQAVVPTWQNVDAAFRALGRRMEADRRVGHDTVVYFAFSGHGAYDDNGDAYLALFESALTRQRLFDALTSLGADYTHLFVDACYAEGVIGFRGVFDNESEATHGRLSDVGPEMLVGNKNVSTLPGLGVVMASSEYQKTHEWSRIESGVFTHEVLSGLSGPADVNRDGRIEYSELLAFIKAANRDVADKRAAIRVIARPPKRLERIPLVDLRDVESSAFLTGKMSSLGHFHIELANGERYLDAHLGIENEMHVILPTDRLAYLILGEREAVIHAAPNTVIEMADLVYSEKGYRYKGAIEASLQSGLFSVKYGPDYYRGIVDSTELEGVRFDEPSFNPKGSALADSGTTPRKIAAIGSWTLAGGAAIAAVVTGTLALKQKNRHSNTLLQDESLEIEERYKKYTAVFWPMAAMVPVGIVMGLVLWPKSNDIDHRESALKRKVTFESLRLKVRF